MKQRTLGGTGIKVSEVGLGCWQIGGADWGDVSESQAFETLRTAVDQGITFWDTSDLYGLGRSESLIGKFLRDCPEKIFVATKLGLYPEPGGAQNLSLATFRLHTEASLKRLGVEALDLTQLHCLPTDVLKQGEVFGWLRALQREGKIRYFGASVETMDEALMCLEQEGLASLQIIFNIFRQKPIETLFEQAKAKGVALIVRLPLASGLLAGKLTRESAFSENDHRRFNRDGKLFNVGETFAGLPFETGVELAESLKPHVPSGMTMAQMALRWCLDFDAVSTVIPGARNEDQVRGNAAASELPPLSAELHRQLEEFYQSQVVRHIRGPY